MKHIADAEAEFVVTNVNPDFCKVDCKVVPYEISQKLSSEKVDYSPDFFAHSAKVLKEGSIIKGVVGNQGEGVLSGVAEGAGDSIMVEGTEHLFVNRKRVCRHGDKALMNVKS